MTLVSVLIPTLGRPDRLDRCLRGLAGQSLPRDRFEVLVGIDGGDAPVLREHAGLRVGMHVFPHAGPAGTRNRLLRLARGDLLLFLNDDVRPAPTLLAEHARAHAARNRPAMILGAAPFVRPADDTAWDRLIRESSMVFFYDRMDADLAAGRAGPDHDWGFRHAWTLNLSMPRTVLEAAGGFDERLRHAMFEDLEMAYRVRLAAIPGTAAPPVLYHPEAVVEHDHRISIQEYLGREQKLGRAAWELAEIAPACSREVFGRDLRSPAEIDECRRIVECDAEIAGAIRAEMDALADAPSDTLTDPAAAYQRHLPLKRWMFRLGLLQAANQPCVHDADRMLNAPTLQA